MFRIARTSAQSDMSGRIFFVCQTLLAVLAMYWLTKNRLPSPGVASICMAFIASALSFYTGIRPLQKSAAISVLLLLLVVALRAIKNDRAQTDAKSLNDKAESYRAAAESKSEQEKRFGAVLLAQEQDFLKTEGRLRDVIRSDQRHFIATIERVNGVLDATREVAATSQHNLDEVMGTNSVPCITPRKQRSSSGSSLSKCWCDRQ